MVLALACLAVLAWRMYLAGFPNFAVERTYYSSDTRVNSIVFGCLLALAANPRDEKPGASNPFLQPMSAALLAAAAIVMLMTIVWRDVYFRLNDVTELKTAIDTLAYPHSFRCDAVGL